MELHNLIFIDLGIRENFKEKLTNFHTFILLKIQA